MKQRITILPAPGRLVRDPRTGRPLDEKKPRSVPKTSYWCRRLISGDVIEASKPKPTRKAKG